MLCSVILQYVLEENVVSGPLFQSLKQLEEHHVPAAPAVIAIMTVLDRTHPKHLHFPNRSLIPYLKPLSPFRP